MHEHTAVLGGLGVRDLPFKVEVLLPTDNQLTAQSVRRRGQRCIRIASLHAMRRPDKVLLLNRLGDIEHRLARGIADTCHGRGMARSLVASRRHGKQCLPEVGDLRVHQQGITGEHRTNINCVRQISGAQHIDNARCCAHRSKIQ